MKTKYGEAWTYHIDELSLLALKAGIEYDEFRHIKETLYSWVEKAEARKQTRNDHE